MGRSIAVVQGERLSPAFAPLRGPGQVRLLPPESLWEFQSLAALARPPSLLPLGRDVVQDVNVHVGPWAASGHPPPRPLLRLGIVPRASAGLLLTRLFMETCTGGAQGSSSPRELIQALPQEPPPHPQPLVTNAASGV